MIPDNVEKIIMTKEDYDRQVEQMLLEKLEAEQRIEKAVEYLKTQLDDFDKYFKNSDKRWKPVISYDYLLNILNGEERY